MKSKLVSIAAAGVILSGFVIASLASAQSTPLSVSCSGAVSNNVIAWSAVATGGTAPYTFLWSGDSQVAGSTSSAVTASYVANGTYTAMIQARDSASSTATATSSCSGTVTSIVTSTSTPPFIMKSVLHIEGNGEFLARGMRVISVGNGSFQGQVWGITYTINWSGNLNGFSEFWFRFNQANPTSTIPTQLAVGDEVSVSGRINPVSPLVVTAGVVRDFSITTPRKSHDDNENNGNNENRKGEGNDNEHKGNDGNKQGQSNDAINNRLNDLFKQLQRLQDLFRARTGGN